MSPNKSRFFHHVGELVRSTSSDSIPCHTSLGSRILGEAKAIEAIVELGLGERGAAIDGMILDDLRAEVGSNKTDPGAVGFVPGTWRICQRHGTWGLSRTKRGIVYEFPINFSLLFNVVNRELCVRGKDLAACEFEVTHALRKRESVTYRSMKYSR